MDVPERQVVLVSADADLARELERARPADVELKRIAPADFVGTGDAPARALWVDLDDWPSQSAEIPRASVFFYGRLPSGSARLPSGVLISKRCAVESASRLWPAAPDGAACGWEARGEDLPGWALDYQILDLRALCHALATRLPAALGYREASLYLADAERQVLTLAGSSCDRPIDLAVRVEDGQHVLAAAVRRGGPAVEGVAGEIPGVYGLATLPKQLQSEPRGRALLAPLTEGGRLCGLLVCCGRDEARADEAVPAALMTFLARSLAHARQYEQARTEARIDGLTGLFNYRWMVETLARELQRAMRHAAPTTLLMLDVDGLKLVNDRYGHRAGDALLRHVAAKVRGVLRQADSAARCGGDEFVLLLPDTDTRGAELVAGRIRRALAEEPVRLDGASIHVAASVGIAQWRSGWSAEGWLEAADQAMYAAKRAQCGGARGGVRGRSSGDHA